MHEQAEPYAIPRLSLAERDRRWAAVRQQMAHQGLQTLLVYGGGSLAASSLSAQYLTHVDMDGIAVVPLEREPFFLLGSGHRWLHWAERSQDWVRDVRPASDLAGVLGEAVEALPAGKVGLVGFKSMTAGLHQDVMTCLSDYETEDASSLVTKLRLVKSAEEIAHMQRAGEIADRAIDTLVEATAAGISEQELHAAGFGALLAGGCEPASHISLEAGPRPFHPVRVPSTRQVVAGDVVVVHINPRYGGYFGHPHVCICVGEPSPEIRRRFAVCAEAFETFKEHARPGTNLADVCRKTLDVIERAGYEWSKEPLVHSIGLAQQEPPVGGVRPTPYPDFELVENNVFGLHPWVGRMAEEFGIDSGRSVVVTKDGGRSIGSRSSVELFVA